MDRIGRQRCSGISSDSTGNTRLAQEIIAHKCPWIIILPDTCHLLNNTAKDIGKIPFFSEVHYSEPTDIHASQSNTKTRPFLVCVPLLNTSTSPHLLSNTSQLSRSMLTLRKGLFLSETCIS